MEAERRQGASAQVTEASTLELVTGSAPAVKLDDKHYKLVDKAPPPPSRASLPHTAPVPSAWCADSILVAAFLCVLCICILLAPWAHAVSTFMHPGPSHNARPCTEICRWRH